ncbi:uncharacterized protein LOC130014266, partial [Patella vulgata]|uniref:uncharacterized protein LOC130014266 n=1 Tax=Patella vulgata TaxID=6465 RepID=UPI0024A9EC36
MPLKEYVQRQYGDVATKCVRQISKLEDKYIRVCNNLTFLMRCRDSEIVPHGLKLKGPVNSNAANKILLQASKSLVRERIQHHRNTKHRLLQDIGASHLTLNHLVTTEDFNSIRKAQTSTNQASEERIKHRHLKKFEQLKKDNVTTKKTDTTMLKTDFLTKTVVNLSSKDLTNDQISLLSKGLKFAPSWTPRNHDVFIANIEKGLCQLAPGGKVDFLRHQIANLIIKSTTKKNSHNITKGETKAIQELKNDKSITIIPADKGKSTVVMNTDEYNSTVNQLLNDATTYRKIRKNPTTTLEKQLNDKLKELCDSQQLTKDLSYQLKPNHPRPPYARATIKTHKNPIKARLLVCSRDSVFYNVAKHMSKLLAPLGTSSTSFIKDSGGFCNTIRDLNRPGKIVSYDVVDLFTNVPRQEAIEVLRTRLNELEAPLETKLSTDSILDLVTMCLDSTFFTWGDDIYKQVNGLPMGSPLSPLISEIFMTEFENCALRTSPITPIIWLRKVDDTFVVLDENDEPMSLLEHLNKQHPRIKFTIETEKENTLPFLDVQVIKVNNQMKTKIYRKPTHTDQYINYNSSHPHYIKRALISTLARRAINICEPEFLQNELDHLRHVFCNLNNYPPLLVKKQINETIKTTSKDYQKPEKSPIRITLPFYGNLTYRVSNLLKKSNIDTTFSVPTTLKQILKANGKLQPILPTQPKGVVYQVVCSCKATYIEETKRPIDKRITEHKSKAATNNSAIAEHLQNHPQHRVKWNEVQILTANQQNKKTRKILEAINIR